MRTIINLAAAIITLGVFCWTAKRCWELVKIYRAKKKLSSADVASVAEDIAGISKRAALLAGVMATLAAPAGLMAFASAIGLFPKPFIIIALPAFIAFAAISACVSAGAKIYAKSVRRKDLRQP